jgi:hypothetical protein
MKFIKEPWHEIFDLWFFINNFPLAPDTRVKAFSKIALNISANYSKTLFIMRRSEYAAHSTAV